MKKTTCHEHVDSMINMTWSDRGPGTKRKETSQNHDLIRLDY